MRERKPLRLKNFDYRQKGIYYITFITKNRINYLSKITNNKSILNEYGNIVKQCWFDLPKYYKNIKLMNYIIMPNHFHGLINILFRSNYSLSHIVGSLKSFSSRKINLIQNEFYFQWNKSFHDRIVRDEEDLIRIQEYIIYNPLKGENSHGTV